MLSTYYTKRGYPIKLLENHYDRAAEFKQDDLLETKRKDENSTPVMVTNFNPNNPDIKGLIKKNWNIIFNRSDYNHIFNKTLIVGFRRLASETL